MTDQLEDRKIPRTMSTQHPDNVNVPEWSQGEVIDGNAEVHEAYYSYATLGCQEVMWDSEGKDVDTRVVRKLFSSHWNYFEKNVLGRDIFLTYRIPNPTIEPIEKKVVVETLLNIPVTYDVASLAYKREIAPIFEIILPFTTSGDELVWLFNYYKRSIVSSEEVSLNDHVRAKDWVGSFKPKAISVIPLVEDYNSALTVDRIINPYIKTVKPKHLRVFVARSDPALNYGLIPAVLLVKIALSKLKESQKETGVSIHPILGVGSKPFRGHLSPENLERFLQEYKGLATATVQSAARYDYPLEQVKDFVRLLNEKLPNGEAKTVELDEEKNLLNAMQKCRKRYESVAENLAPLVNSVAAYVPQRRARKLHIGLFGYSRNVAGVSLPRAITFAAAMYSIGIPPEFIGCQALADLNDEEWDSVKRNYVNLEHDLTTVSGYVSWENVDLLREAHEKTSERANINVEKLEKALMLIQKDLETAEEKLVIKLGPKTPVQKRHANFTNNFLISFIERDNDQEAKQDLLEAAKLRKCLG